MTRVGFTERLAIQHALAPLDTIRTPHVFPASIVVQNVRSLPPTKPLYVQHATHHFLCRLIQLKHSAYVKAGITIIPMFVQSVLQDANLVLTG